MFKAQSLASVFMSDTAAENAALQFNASSSNQVDMFFSNLQTQIQQSNVDQRNAMERFNAGEANAISQFNSAQQNARDQFNANNALVVAQANTQWEQAITTMDNAAQNQANRDAAIVANNLTETTYNNMLQQERDALDYAVRIADREDQQEHALTLQGISNDAAASAASGTAVGTVIATASTLLLKKAIMG
jgi:predicted HNH restriction endonuclease